MITTAFSQLLTPAQVSEILGISQQTLAVWRCTKRYELRYCKTGRLVRYRAEDVQAFIERRTHGNPDPA